MLVNTKYSPERNKSWVVFLSTYPPRECGLATFTQDLAQAFNHLYTPGVETKVVAMNVDELSRFNYPKKVIMQISQSRIEDYLEVSQRLNELPQVKLIIVQHEFGIFGGEWGENLLAFLEKNRKPVVITLHTVLPQPRRRLKEVMGKLCEKVNRVIVMTKLSKEILTKDYGIGSKKIQVIPHGIHPLPFTNGQRAKAILNLSGKTVLSTFGLLNRDKGIEYVIRALPPIVHQSPDVLYLIIGVTHPLVLKAEGERYRNSLAKEVYDLELTSQVRFYNRYLELEELLLFLQATDIYLSPALNPNQTVSGTLTYALGAGRPVISTPFAQAREYVTPEVGTLVDFRDLRGFRLAILKLLQDEERRLQMGKNAYFLTRNLTWPNVAIAYMKSFAGVIPTLVSEEKHLPKVKLAHLVRLTDNFGVFQFAKLTEPDLESGYTTDDNARALVAALEYYQKFRAPVALKLANIYLNFLKYTAKPSGYFGNFVNYDRTINRQKNSQASTEDASARALQALAYTAVAKGVPKKLRDDARMLFSSSLNLDVRFTHLRSAAFYVIALSLWLSERPDTVAEKKLIKHADLLVNFFRKNADQNWQWFENRLTYANAVIPESLLRCYALVGEKKHTYFRVGKSSLDFLISQTFRNNMYVPVGQGGWYTKGEKRAIFDQQPEDVYAMVRALKVIYQATGGVHYKRLMQTAFQWFLGNNTLGQVMYDQATGGCYDGLGEKHINLNQGAESTISYLLARLNLEKLD